MPREDILKHVYLSHLLDVGSIYSLYLAYLNLGEKVPATIVHNLRKLALPPPGWPITDYRTMMKSLRPVVNELYTKEDMDSGHYDAIANWESAARIVIDGRPSYSIEAIKVDYDPLKLIKNLKSKSRIIDNLEKRRRCLAVFWDQDEKKLKQAEIPSELGGLFHPA